MIKNRGLLKNGVVAIEEKKKRRRKSTSKSHENEKKRRKKTPSANSNARASRERQVMSTPSMLNSDGEQQKFNYSSPTVIKKQGSSKGKTKSRSSKKIDDGPTVSLSANSVGDITKHTKGIVKTKTGLIYGLHLLFMLSIYFAIPAVSMMAGLIPILGKLIMIGISMLYVGLFSSYDLVYLEYVDGGNDSFAEAISYLFKKIPIMLLWGFKFMLCVLFLGIIGGVISGFIAAISPVLTILIGIIFMLLGWWGSLLFSQVAYVVSDNNKTKLSSTLVASADLMRGNCIRYILLQLYYSWILIVPSLFIFFQDYLS